MVEFPPLRRGTILRDACRYRLAQPVSQLRKRSTPRFQGPLSEAFIVLVGAADAGTPRPCGGALEPAQSRAEADAIDVAFRRTAVCGGGGDATDRFGI